MNESLVSIVLTKSESSANPETIKLYKRKTVYMKRVQCQSQNKLFLAVCSSSA